MLAQILKGIAKGKRRGQGARRIGQQDLLAVAGGKHAGEAVECGGEIVAIFRRGLTSVNRHPHSQWPKISPILSPQGELGGDGGGDRVRNRWKGRLRGIAYCLEQDAILVGDGFAKEREVALDCSRHRLPVSLPERGAAFDVGEEKGDRAAGKRGHRPSLDILVNVIETDSPTDREQTTGCHELSKSVRSVARAYCGQLLPDE